MIGYYPFRAKAQVLRLLCEYLELPYRDVFFNPDQWNKFKETEAKDWIIKEIPFLKHDNFVITNSNAMVDYACGLAQRTDLLGKNLQDMTYIDSFRSRGDPKDTILGLLVSLRPGPNGEKVDRKKKLVECY